MSELERSYRRLLRAYPAFYRRERGLEILTTLLDAAGPEQVRPSRGEASHLLLMGLRYRFVPPTRIGRIAAGFVAIWAALVLSGAGALAVWAFADPQKPDLAALSDDLVGRPASSTSDVPGEGLLDMAYSFRTSGEFQYFAEEGWDGARPAPMGQTRYYERVTPTSTVVADLHRRLAGAGWRTGTLSQADVNGLDRVFWAARDGMLVRVSGFDHKTGVMVGAFPVEPGGVLAGAIAGFALGLIVASHAMTSLAHRVALTPPSTRRLVVLVGLPAVVACAVNTLDNVLSMVPGTPGGVLLGADYMYPLANQIANPLAAGVVGVGLLGCAGLVARAGQPRPVRAD